MVRALSPLPLTANGNRKGYDFLKKNMEIQEMYVHKCKGGDKNGSGSKN
jgi:hypothetical protein